MIATCLLHLWAIWHSPPLSRKPQEFALPSKPSPSPEDGPVSHAEFIFPPLNKGIAHASSICELSDGSLASVWYAGSREGAQDVAIHFSRHPSGGNGSWTEPRVIVSSDSAAHELNRFVKKVGNSLIFSDSNGRLWLVYVTISLGGWSGSSLNVKTSDDFGDTWSKSQRLTLSPFFNVSELVRNAPVPLSGGGFAIPIYHEFLGRFPELLLLRSSPLDGGIAWTKRRMEGGRSFIQPSVVAYNPQSAVAFFRCMSNRKAVAKSTTLDGGCTWSKPGYLDLPNPNSALSGLLLPDGKMLLTCNDSRSNRNNLRLAVSNDNGAHWTRIATLEDEEGKEFSYPFMILDRHGRVHLVYTWKRKSIKHVVMNDRWIQGQLRNEGE